MEIVGKGRFQDRIRLCLMFFFFYLPQLTNKGIGEETKRITGWRICFLY